MTIAEANPYSAALRATPPEDAYAAARSCVRAARAAQDPYECLVMLCMALGWRETARDRRKRNAVSGMPTEVAMRRAGSLRDQIATLILASTMCDAGRNRGCRCPPCQALEALEELHTLASRGRTTEVAADARR